VQAVLDIANGTIDLSAIAAQKAIAAGKASTAENRSREQ
jgi:hypothetical protein